MRLINRFWLSLILSLPMLVEMLIHPLTGWMLPGGKWTMLILTSIIMLISGGPFIQSAWASFQKHYSNMDTLVAIGTVTAYGYSLYAVLFNQPVFFESVAFVITFVLLGQVFEERMRKNASSAIEKLINLQAKDAEVLRNGEYVRIPLSEIQVNDLIRVKPGQKVAVDGQIVEGKSALDESMVTGESMPVTKQAGDMVVGSTLNTTGTFIFKAQKIGEATMLSQIIAMVKKAQNSHAPIQKLTDRLSNIFVPVVLIVAILTFLVWYVFLGATLPSSLIFAVSVIVIACPCALGLATPTALMVGTGRGAKLGILIKNGETLEKINDIKTIVFDKTGTITVGKPEVTDVIGDADQVVRLAAALEGSSEHPLASAITKLAQTKQLELPQITDFKVIEGQGVQAKVAGQLVLVGNEQLVDLQTTPPKIRLQIQKLKQAAKTLVYVSLNQQVIGTIAIQDAPKPTAKADVAQLNSQGYQTVMLTGDNEQVAHQIAQEVGIQQVIANVLPADKVKQIEALQADNQVAFVGDGINDAPALSTADVGIAMGSGTDVAIESGDIVLVKNDLRDVAKALELSHKTFQRIKLNLFWAFIYNVLGIPIAAGIFYFVGLTLSPELAGLAMALSSISVVTSSLLLNKTPIGSKLNQTNKKVAYN